MDTDTNTDPLPTNDTVSREEYEALKKELESLRNTPKEVVKENPIEEALNKTKSITDEEELINLKAEARSFIKDFISNKEAGLTNIGKTMLEEVSKQPYDEVRKAEAIKKVYLLDEFSRDNKELLKHISTLHKDIIEDFLSDNGLNILTKPFDVIKLEEIYNLAKEAKGKEDKIKALYNLDKGYAKEKTFVRTRNDFFTALKNRTLPELGQKGV